MTLPSALLPLDALDLNTLATTTSAPARAPYTLDQIAGQLTDGYWNTNGEGWRAFDVGPGGTLTYDASVLSATERYLAVSAMQAWTDVTGIKFVATSTPLQINEGADARASIQTTHSMLVNQNFHGAVSGTGDQDWVRIQLVAGKQYTFTLETGATGGLLDAYLELRNASGGMITADDDSGGNSNSEITFTASTTGTYYLVARGYDAETGTYDLSAFDETVSLPDIIFNNSDIDGGAFSTSELSGAEILSSYVNVDANWDADPISINSYWFQTYIHEIGHALGLGHAGNYNGGATWGTSNIFDNDSWQATVMSYFSQTDNPNIDADFAYLATVMPADIIAIQNLYGTNVSTRSGNTTYGANGNVTGYLGDLMKMFFNEIPDQQKVYIDNPIAFTIYDTGGVDTINLSPVNAVQTINLNGGGISNVGGLKGNMQIARGTVIEKAIGGNNVDTIYGNSAANSLAGRGGSDRLLGAAGNDLLNGGIGNDTMDGGIGADTAVFTATQNVTVRLGITTAQATGQGTDTLTNIENVFSGDGHDRIYGNDLGNSLIAGAGNDSLYGSAGSDTLRNDAGNDVLYGGTDVDTLVFAGTTAARVNLGLTIAQGTGYGTDLISGIENISSGLAADKLIGNTSNNIIISGAGNDSIAGAAGNDRLYGQAGNDVLFGGAGNDVYVGGTGADDFSFYGGADRIADFTNNQDEVYLSRALWGGGAKTVAQMLSFAHVVGGVVAFNFGGGNSLVLTGVSSVSVLADDILSY